MTGRGAGDPEGRRIAWQKAQRLAEAGRLAHALRSLLRRAGAFTNVAGGLADDIKYLETSELMKAQGRIEPRKRFKGAPSHPLLAGRSSCGLYIDECGKSHPEPHLNDSLFVAGAVAMTPNAKNLYVRRANALKLKYFGPKEITFHEPRMSRFQGDYFLPIERRDAFRKDLQDLIERSAFTFFGVAIRKNAFEREFVKTGVDPYLPVDCYSVAILMLMERFVDFLASARTPRLGDVVLESQGPREDAEHQLAFTQLLVDGSQWVSASAFRSWLRPGIGFVPKAGSHPTELADIGSRAMFEWVRDGFPKPSARWKIFEQKTYWRGDGRNGKFGVKIFPDSDIRDTIEQRRDEVMAG